MECVTCNHSLIERSRFCDSCGDPTTRLDLDQAALLEYCSKCSGQLRGTKKYCIHCGEPSPHSGKFRNKREASWLEQVLMDPRVQMAILATILILVALPMVTPVRYRLTTQIPFVEVYMEEPEQPVGVRSVVNRSRENFRIRPVVDPNEDRSDGMNIGVPGGVARDSRGNLYVSDSAGHVVYKIATDQTRTVYAGVGQPGYSGDGGLATRAELNRPRGLEIDDQDGLLIADSGNNVVRRVDRSGTIRTVAGGGVAQSVAELTKIKLASAAEAFMMSPVDVSADVDGTLYVSEGPCEAGPREPTVWVLEPKS